MAVYRGGHAIRSGFVIQQNISILTDNGRLKKMMSLGCVTFNFYGGLEKRREVLSFTDNGTLGLRFFPRGRGGRFIYIEISSTSYIMVVKTVAVRRGFVVL